MVDAADLRLATARREGSNPSGRTKNMCDKHEIAFVEAGKNHPKFPYGYRYLHYCWKCGWVQWSAEEHAEWNYYAPGESPEERDYPEGD
jgi:hypothetical protein